MKVTKPGRQFRFEPYRLDTANECLWRALQRISLTPKAFAVLLYLVEHAGRLVTKQELIQAVWPDAFVGDGVLKAQIKEIRRCLEDDAAAPQFIETLHRRGYRFKGNLSAGGVDPAPSKSVPEVFVGRRQAMAKLEGCLEKALSGQRQVVFVTGEAGVGKTTVVQAFLDRAARRADIWTARGQGLEQYCGGEAYLPLLDAIGRLSREQGRESLVGWLRKFAPTWLFQMSSLVSPDDRERLHREVFGATPERMVREISEAMEALAAANPLIVVLEDLHWADNATLDVINSLAVRPGPARLLLIGTLRPADAMVARVPLRSLQQGLQAKRLSEDLPLDLLTVQDVGDYLSARFSHHVLPEELAEALHRRTEGNPLFLVNAVDYLISNRAIVSSGNGWMLCCPLEGIELGVPDSVVQMIEKQIEQLPPEEQRFLEGASVIGMTFSTASLAHVLGMTIEEVEDRCHSLDKRVQFLRPASVDRGAPGVLDHNYVFVHSLYQEVLYRRVPEGRRRRLHLSIVEFAETARAGSQENAAELAMHSERGGDVRRALSYLAAASGGAARRLLLGEAVEYLNRALELANQIPPIGEASGRMELLGQRARLRLALNDSPGAADDYLRLATFARESGQHDIELKAQIESTLALLHFDRERLTATLSQVAESRAELPEVLRAHAAAHLACASLYTRGWSEEDARAAEFHLNILDNCKDAKMRCLSCFMRALLLCFRSEYTMAARKAGEARQLALEIGDSYLYLGSGAHFLSWALLHSGRLGEVLLLSNDVVASARKNQSGMMEAGQNLFVAWVHLEAFDFEASREICEREWLRLQQSGPEVIVRFHCLLLLGKAYLGCRDLEGAHKMLGEVLQLKQQQGNFIDLHLALLFEQNCAEYWLAARDLAQARSAAERLCELAADQGERTYLALGRRLIAEIAMAQDRRDEAEKQILAALDALENSESSIAEWRVCQTAAAVLDAAGRRDASESCRARWMRAVDQVASSLRETPALRQSLSEHAREPTHLPRLAGR